MRKKVPRTLFCLIWLGTFVAQPALSQLESEALGEETPASHQNLEPLYELGVGGALGFLPDYPGSDQGKVRSMVLPYGIYRGRVLRADKDGGVRTSILKGLRYEMDLSFGGSFPASSEDNRARTGMDDLDWLFEIGPQLKFHLLNSQEYRIELRLPVRASFSTNFSKTVDRGYNITPHVVMQKKGFPYPGANFLLEGTLFYASERLSQYFYQVDPGYSTVDRPRYDARPGYVGWTLTVGQSFPFYDNGFYVAYRYMNYSGAANRVSPLFRASENHSLGIGLIWQLYESKQKVSAL